MLNVCQNKLLTGDERFYNVFKFIHIKFIRFLKLFFPNVFYTYAASRTKLSACCCVYCFIPLTKRFYYVQVVSCQLNKRINEGDDDDWK